MLYFKVLSYNDKENFIKFSKEYLDTSSGDISIPHMIKKDAIDDFDSFYKFIKSLENKENLPNGYVISYNYLIMENYEIVGVLSIRFDTNDLILNKAGHIGYGIIKRKRRKGYATKAMLFAMEELKKENFKDCIVTTHKNNIASQKTIIKCGGIFQRENDDMLIYKLIL